MFSLLSIDKVICNGGNKPQVYAAVLINFHFSLPNFHWPCSCHCIKQCAPPPLKSGLSVPSVLFSCVERIIECTKSMTSEMAAEFYAVPHFQAQKKVWPHPICTSPPNCLGKWQNAEKEEIWEEGGGEGILQCSGNWWRGINDIPNLIIPWKSE